MTRKSRLTFVLAAIAASAAAVPAHAGKCVLAGGEGSNVLPDVAKFMANAALGNSISGAGMKAAGAVKMTCKSEVLLTTCVAKQRACK
ncbi:MAG: hypothetical protein ACK4MF_10280 [Hyphomicrobiaceae bacterium]